MPLEIVRNDITKMKVDAIVNAANTKLQMGGGVCGTIFQASGQHELQQECNSIGKCETGHAVITKGYKLPAKHIIHTVGPVWSGGKNGESELLRDCYLNSLNLARKNNCDSIAFPLISSGTYGYPKDEALKIATSAIREFLSENDMSIYLVVFDKAAFFLSEDLLGSVHSFIDEHYVSEHTPPGSQHFGMSAGLIYNPLIIGSSIASISLKDILRHLDEPFSITLFRLIDAKGKTDVEVYKRANIDRKLFSKIRNNKTYIPSKKTAVAFAIALELSLDETKDLLERAGYTLSHSQMFDLIVEYFIINKNYDIFAINEALFKFDQPLLGT